MDTIVHLLAAHVLVVVFLNVLAAQVGLPLPMVPVLVVMGARSMAGEVAVEALFGVAVAACLVADFAWYAAGQRYGSRVLRTVCRLSMSPDSCVRQTQSLFARWGVWTLVVAKFIPGLGPISTALSGQTRLALPVFVLLDALGASLFVGVAIGLGRAFHSAVDNLLGMLAGFGEVGLAVIVGALLLFVAFRFAQRHWLIRALRMTRISVAELERLRHSDSPHAIYDVRASASRERDGTIPGALPWSVEAKELPPAAAAPDVEVIVYCDCPNDYSAAKVAYRLRQAGFTNVRPLHGGIDAWIAAGLPVERLHHASSLAALP
ncbi:MAG: VTT domain-containing protein [Pseudomonadota bacterium]|nr:VTT domain-containing protein [Pseudomonadota bacterium]